MKSENQNLNEAQPAGEAPLPFDQEPEQPNILTRLARAIDRAISDDPKRKGAELTQYMILDNVGGQILIVGPKGLEKLRVLQRRREHAQESINSHTQDQAKIEWQKHLQTLTEAAGTGTSSQHEGWTREDFESDFYQKIEAAKAEMRRIYSDAQPMCQEISDRFISIANRKVKAMEDSEKERHENFGVPYLGPSNLIVAFKKAIEQAGHRTQLIEGGTLSPREMLPYLNW